MTAIRKGGDVPVDRWADRLKSLGYREEAVRNLLSDTRLTPYLCATENALLVPQFDKQASEMGQRRIFSIPFAEGVGDYAALRGEYGELLDEFIVSEKADFVSTRILSSNLPAIHALISRGFYPVEVLIHSFYSIESAALVSDQMTSDVGMLKAEDAEAAFALMLASGMKSHIHMDPNLPPDLGDFAMMVTIESYIGKKNAVTAKRQGKVVGFLAGGPRKVPLAGFGPTVEAVLGAISTDVTDAWSVMRDLLGVLYNVLPEEFELFEVRVPSYAFNQLSMMFESKPARVETSMVLHWLKK